MGPPSEDDGKVSVRDGCIPLSVLQWGRRPRTTERMSARPAPHPDGRASMGPPSEDDGKSGDNGLGIRL